MSDLSKQVLAATLMAAETASAGIPLKWVRTTDPVAQVEVRDGVCILYAPDHRDGDIPGVEKVLERCLQAPSLKTTAPDGGIMLQWDKFDSPTEMWQAHDKIQGKRPAGVGFSGGKLKMGGGLIGSDPYARGVQFDQGGVSRVFTAAPHLALGHEIKHAFDGRYHK